MNAPSTFVPLRGGAVEVYFLAEAIGQAAWYFVHDVGHITEDEKQQIQAAVDTELKHRQSAWRDLAETKRKIRVITGSSFGGDAA